MFKHNRCHEILKRGSRLSLLTLNLTDLFRGNVLAEPTMQKLLKDVDSPRGQLGDAVSAVKVDHTSTSRSVEMWSHFYPACHGTGRSTMGRTHPQNRPWAGDELLLIACLNHQPLLESLSCSIIVRKVSLKLSLTIWNPSPFSSILNH